jgi:hypothetical protein
MSGFQGYDQWKTASPYDDEIEDNTIVENAFSDYHGPYDLYRAVYKYTPCGPTVGFTFYPGPNGGKITVNPASTYEPPHNRTFYGDDLRKAGSWADLRELGLLITEISVSSIVEGVDQCTDTEYVDCDGTGTPEELSDLFWQAVESVNKQADEIWNDTHGCPDCYEYPEDELHPVDPECKSCRGHGAII